MARPTIADIATRAGVSKGAVSFALNGRPGVSDATRERILKIAEQMSWRPHSAARALGASRVDSVGMVIARPARTLGVEPFFAHLLSGVQSGLSAESISLQLLIVEDTAAEIEVYRRWASEHRVDGVILVDLTVKDPRVDELKALELPAVVIGGRGGKGALASVWADDRDAMLAIVEYLAALGHRRIAHVAGTPNFQHTQRRIRAVRDAAPRLGLVDAPSLTTDFSDAEGAAITRKLLSQPNRPTAIVYDSDVMAVAGLGVAMEMGVAVPRAVDRGVRRLDPDPADASGTDRAVPGHLRLRPPGRRGAARHDRRPGHGDQPPDRRPGAHGPRVDRATRVMFALSA